MGKLFKQKELINKYKINENKRVNKSNENSNLLDFDNLILDKNQFERFDTYSGLFNTQQLLGAIDFSEFRNHCFFDSAVSKVEYTFNKIYDEFPLDGSSIEVDQYFRSFDGFGKFIYNQIDKNIGYLKFNNNAHIEVTNKAGYLFSLNRNDDIISKLTKPILNPKNSEFSIDFRIYLQDNVQYNNHPVFQYLDNKIINGVNTQNGFTFFVKNNIANSLTEVVFILTDGVNNKKLYSSFQILRNTWEHISLSINSSQNKKNIVVYLNGVEIQSLQKESDILSNSSLDISNDTKFYIGKAISNHIISNNNNYNFQLNNNNEKFIGFLDEFRFYHKNLTSEEIILKKETNEFANDLLKLYFRFNEPAGTYGNNSICFDYSGNSLHSRIIADSGTLITNLRYNYENDLIKPSLRFENDDFNPVLFPSFTKNRNLNETYLNKAKEWDIFNSNLIFKLFPRHYFDEGAAFEGLSESFNNEAAKTYYITDTDLPGQQKVEAIQTFANLLIIWARFFDEIKLYLDIMPKLIDIDYEDINTAESVVNFFLPLMTKKNGFIFKELLNNNTNKILDGYVIGADGADKSQYNMRYIQNQIWKRILVNSKDMIMSKGTKQAIKSIFNSVGINYDEYYKFREYGKSLNSFIEKNYIKKNKDFKIINFNKTNKNLILKSKLNNLPNSLFSQNSYTFEFFLNYFNVLQQKSLSESIFKLVNTTKSNELLLELIFEKNAESLYGDFILFLKNNDNSITDYLKIENLNIFDNNLQFSIHVENKVNEIVLSLVCQTCEKDVEYFKSDYVFAKSNQIKPKIFEIVNDILEINIGNNISFRNIFEFNGNISNIKLWNVNLSKNDINMHAMNQFSIANDQYKLNKNLNKNLSEFLLLHLSCQDDVYHKELNGENINLIDFSELTTTDLYAINYPHKLICNNPIISIDRIINKQIVIYENDIKFDEPNFENKVKVMSFSDVDLAEEYNVAISPVYNVEYINQQKNDVRFSIEMSNIKHLNEDIAKLFNDVSFLKNIISDFSVMNDSYYNNIEKFSDFYFKRIKSDKIQITPLYEMYQILDNILTDMLSDFISTRVKFNNNIYVIESHALERHKFNYKFMESHILMKGDYSIVSNTNTRKSNNYLNLSGRRF